MSKALEVLRELTRRIKDCPSCKGLRSGYDYGICASCGNKGRVLEDCTEVIPDIEAAIAAATSDVAKSATTASKQEEKT